jgi:hypothetical protein
VFACVVVTFGLIYIRSDPRLSSHRSSPPSGMDENIAEVHIRGSSLGSEGEKVQLLNSGSTIELCCNLNYCTDLGKSQHKHNGSDRRLPIDTVPSLLAKFLDLPDNESCPHVGYADVSIMNYEQSHKMLSHFRFQNAHFQRPARWTPAPSFPPQLPSLQSMSPPLSSAIPSLAFRVPYPLDFPDYGL